MIYGYLRVSTDKQDENNQRAGVDEKACKMCLSIDEYIIDAGVSGTKEPEKRKLGALMEKLKPGDMIIASELSRLGRSLYMVMRILEHCMKHNVKVITVKDGYELGDNIQSKVLAFAFALAAEIERDMISQRTKEALAVKIKAGMMCGRPQGSRTGSTKLKSRRDEIIEFLKKGFSYCAIAKQTGVHRSTVKKYCLENNLVKFHDKKFDGRFVNKYSTQTAIEKVATQRELLSKIKSGLTYAEIGKLYGIHAASIRKYIQERKRLYQEYLSVQNKKRIAANGGLRINKGYKGLK